MAWDDQKERELEAILDRFTSFMKAHIYKYNIQRLGLDIDDILQETRIKIWKMIKSEKNITNYASYIRKIVDTSVMDFIRKFKRDEEIYFKERTRNIGELNSGYDTDYIYEQADLKDLVGKAVESLIESRRKVVKLYLLNLSLEEIALYYRWSPHKARNLLYRGLLDLKRILRDKNINYEHQP
jgi:RNA polymerase sigma-70 factor (ECF subfamily)